MCGVIRLGQMLEVQPRVDLRGRDVGMAQQFLNRAQVAARLQHMARKGMAQHVRMHRRHEAGLLAALAQQLPHRVRRHPCALGADEQRGYRMIAAHLEPIAQRLARLAAHRHDAALAALAEHVGLHRIEIDPAQRRVARLCIEPRELAHAQATAIEHFDDGAVARLGPGVGLLVVQLGEPHRVVHAQRLRQRPAGLGRVHVLHRVEADQPLVAEPAVEAAPARQHQRNAARLAPGAVQLCHPAADVGGLHAVERQTGLGRVLPQRLQVKGIELDRARREPALDAHMLQVLCDPVRGSGCSRLRRGSHDRHC
jgi:hypothetical protein